MLKPYLLSVRATIATLGSSTTATAKVPVGFDLRVRDILVRAFSPEGGVPDPVVAQDEILATLRNSSTDESYMSTSVPIYVLHRINDARTEPLMYLKGGIDLEWTVEHRTGSSNLTAPIYVHLALIGEKVPLAPTAPAQ